MEKPLTLEEFIDEVDFLFEQDRRWELLQLLLTLHLPFFRASDYEELEAKIATDAENDMADGSLSTLMLAGLLLRVIATAVFVKEVLATKGRQGNSLRLNLLAESCIAKGRKEVRASIDQDVDPQIFIWDPKFN